MIENPNAEWLRKRLDELEAENTRLRAALAQSDRPCAYCALPADKWAECASGFPGCARGDDAMGCPHLGASLELYDLKRSAHEADALPYLMGPGSDLFPEPRRDATDGVVTVISEEMF